MSLADPPDEELLLQAAIEHPALHEARHYCRWPRRSGAAQAHFRSLRTTVTTRSPELLGEKTTTALESERLSHLVVTWIRVVLSIT